MEIEATCKVVDDLVDPLPFLRARAQTHTGLDKRFKELEANSKVDDDLAALKGLLGGSSTEPAKMLKYVI